MARGALFVLAVACAFVACGTARGGDFSVEDARSGMRASVRFVKSGTRTATTRTIPGGIEDWVELAKDADGPPFLEWEVALDERTAGLRLVASTLELLDDAGAPRLRMAPPWALDARDRVVPLDVAVRGCDADASPRAPFHRPVTPPGARACIIHVSWERHGLALPARVDPAWTSTASLAHGRYRHTATRLPSGDVLVAGGFVYDPVVIDIETTSTEIYSPALGAWATGAPMKTARAIAAAAPLANGDVLVTGGLTDVGGTVLGSSEIYSVATGTWTTTGSLAVPRSGHTATPLGDGTILVAAGYDNSGVHWTTAERFSGGTFLPAGDINTTRFFHSAVALSGGRVLLGGGTDPDSGPLGSLELYTAGVGWAPAASLASMTTPRTLAAAAVLPDGDVLFAAGYGGQALASAERYRPSTNTWIAVAGSMAKPRWDTVAAVLANGDILFVGGQTLAAHYRDAERFDAVTGLFDRFVGPSNERAFGHTATTLADGRVLAVGGYDYPSNHPIAKVDLFDVALPTVDAGAEIDDAGDASDRPDASDASDASAGADAAAVVDAIAADDAAVEPPVDAASALPSPADERGRTFEVAGGCTLHASRSPMSLLGVVVVAALAIARRRRA